MCQPVSHLQKAKTPVIRTVSLISAVLGTLHSSLGDYRHLSSFCGVPHSELHNSPHPKLARAQRSKETRKPSGLPWHTWVLTPARSTCDISRVSPSETGHEPGALTLDAEQLSRLLWGAGCPAHFLSSLGPRPTFLDSKSAPHHRGPGCTGPLFPGSSIRP